MKKIALAFPALVAAALAVSGCAKHGEDANAAAVNEVSGDDANGVDANLSADLLDENATATNAADESGNAL